MSSSAPPFSDVTTAGGVLRKLTILSAPVGVLNVKFASPVEAVGMLTTPMRPVGVALVGVLKTTLVLLAMLVVSKVGGGVTGVLANWMVWKPITVGPSIAVND